MSQLLTPQQTANLLSVSKQTLAAWRCREPERLAWVEVSPRCIRYRAEDVQAFVSKRTRGGAR